MPEFTAMGTNPVNLDDLEKRVKEARLDRKKEDAPPIRLTKNTFQHNVPMMDLAKRGDLAASIENFNNGGYFDSTLGQYIPKDFWLMRVFDFMEFLGRKQFELFAPGVWENTIKLYYSTFGQKILKDESAKSTPPKDEEKVHRSSGELYGV
jgi:hypothetical protein